MGLSYAAAGVPGVLVFCAAVVVAIGTSSSDPGLPALKPGADIGRVRASLLAAVPVGTPADIAFGRLTDKGLSCAVFKPPLANLTWRVIGCSTSPSGSGETLSIDVAGRNGVVADIGAEDPSCASRADITDPAPEPGGCDISGERYLAGQARTRAAERALLAEMLGAARPHPEEGASAGRPGSGSSAGP